MHKKPNLIRSIGKGDCSEELILGEQKEEEYEEEGVSEEHDGHRRPES
jgi:hypothetical protein